MSQIRTIAVIGSGISGLSATWLLSKKYEVTLYEKNDYVGGHTNTRSASFGDVTVAADTGFMVFNHQTYHNLVPLFRHFNVPTIETDMAFGITIGNGQFEFSSDDVFAQRSNAWSPRFWRMLIDIIRFNKRAMPTVASHDDEYPLGELLKELGVSTIFSERYLLPMAGAIWSTGKDNILNYPAKHFISFCDNHGLLSPATFNPFKLNQGRLQWYTVAGGANVYVERMLEDTKASILTGFAVRSVVRNDEGVVITDGRGKGRDFDAVVLATHPDQALRLLSDASSDEVETLGSFEYSRNETVMHKDTSFMMRHAKRWPSWTYSEPSEGATELSYYMNRLQHIDPSTPVIVTLNPSRNIDESDTFYRVTYEHPKFTVRTRRAQEKLSSMQGSRATYYAGAWLGHGFHEDGLVSGLRVANALGVHAPWQENTEGR